MTSLLERRKRLLAPLRFEMPSRARTSHRVFMVDKDGVLSVKREECNMGYDELKDSKGDIPVMSRIEYSPSEKEVDLYDMLTKRKWVHRGLIAEGCDSIGPFSREDVYTLDRSCQGDMDVYHKEKKEEDVQPYIYPRLRIVDEVEEREVKRQKVDTPCCSLHGKREMAIKEIETKNGPAQLHYCPEEGCVVSCFGTNEERDTFLDAVARSLHFKYRKKDCPLRCFCDEMLLLKLSRSEKNPNRLYFCCRKRTCNMFQWGDDWPHKKVFERV